MLSSHARIRRLAPFATSLAVLAMVASSAAVMAQDNTTTLGSNESDEVPKTAVHNIVDFCQEQTGITVNVTDNDHNTFQNQISTYLQGTPDDVVKWFAELARTPYAYRGRDEVLDSRLKTLERDYARLLRDTVRAAR